MSASNNHPAHGYQFFHLGTWHLLLPLSQFCPLNQHAGALLSISLSFGGCFSESHILQVGLNFRGRFYIRRESPGPADCQAIPVFGALWVLSPLSEAYGSDDVNVHTTFLLLLPVKPPHHGFQDLERSHYIKLVLDIWLFQLPVELD